MASLEFRLKKIVETRNDLIEDIKHNDLMSEKYKDLWVFKLCWTLSYFSYSNYCLCFNFCISLVFVPVGIPSSAVGINLCYHCRKQKV